MKKQRDRKWNKVNERTKKDEGKKRESRERIAIK